MSTEPGGLSMAGVALAAVSLAGHHSLAVFEMDHGIARCADHYLARPKDDVRK